MRHVRTLIPMIVGLTVLFASGPFGSVAASPAMAGNAVFVMTNNPSSNAVRVFDQSVGEVQSLTVI
jgi:hypothetical protein